MTTSKLRARIAAVSAAALAGCASGGVGGSLSREAATPAAGSATAQAGSPPIDESGVTDLLGVDVVRSQSGLLILTVDGKTIALDASQAPLETLVDGLLAQRVVSAAGWTAHELELAFGRQSSRAQIVLFESPTQNTGVAVFADDPSVRPTIPTMGTASYESMLAGFFSYGELAGFSTPDEELGYGRGLVSADFGAGRVVADFPDVDFIVDGVHLETTRLGHDFGVWAEGSIGDGVFGLMGSTQQSRDPGSVTGTFGMEIFGGGRFLGSAGAAPTGVAGAMTMIALQVSGDVNGAMDAGFEGVCGCTAPTPAIPTTGVATFDTGINGVLRYDSFVNPAIDELMYGRGTIDVNFGAHTLQGSIPDVDFIRVGKMSETTLVGHDFGLTLAGSVSGSNVTFTANTPNTDPGAFGFTAKATGVITGAPGRLELGARADIQTTSDNPLLGGVIGFSGEAPAPGR